MNTQTSNLPIDNCTIYFVCHIIFQGYFYILMFVIYLDKYFCIVYNVQGSR
jgi:hypothetical protein